MTAEVSLRGNVAWTLAGNIVYAACQWGIFLALARLGNPTMVGQFALGFAIANPVFLFSQLQLRALQATDASHAEFSPATYVALRLSTTALGMAGIVGLAACAGYRRETAWVIALAGVAKACESMSDVFYGRLQQHERMAEIARSMMLRGTLSLAAVAIALWVSRSAIWGAAALAGAWMMVLALHDAPAARALGRRGGFAWDWPAMRRLARQAFPLGIVTTLAALDTNIPRYMIAHRLGERALGIFAAVASLQAAGMILVNALGQSAATRLARYHFTGDRGSFWGLMAKLLALALAPGVALVAVALAAGDVVPPLLFGSAYAHERTLFVWLSIATAFWLVTSMLGFAATARRRIAFQPWVLAVVAAVSLAVCSFAVPRFGVVGGAMASTVSAAAALVLYAAGVFAHTEGFQALHA
jgi:O-antigen/teichoic acid export membrane protein